MTFIKLVESKLEPFGSGYIYEEIENGLWLCKTSAGRVIRVTVNSNNEAIEVEG